MQTTINTNALNAMLTGFKKVMQTKYHLPILDFAHVAKDATGEVTFTVTNLSETLAYTLPAETQNKEDGPGAFLCAVEELKKAAVGLKKDDAITLTPVGAETVRIGIMTGGHAISREVGSIAVSEFPSNSLGNTKLKPCDTTKFLAAYKTAMCAAATDESRRTLCAVFADTEASAMVATDGRRMLRSALDNMPLDKSLILPITKVLSNGILGMTDGFIGGIAPKTGTPLLEIRGGPWHYCVKCVDGNYPNYKQVIPNDQPSDVEFSFAEQDIPLLKTAIGQLDGGKNAGVVALHADANGVSVLTTKAGEDGRFPFITLPNSKASCNSVMQAVNSEFLLDAINAGFRNVRAPQGLAPLKFRLPDGGESVYVLMAMRNITAELLAFAREQFKSNVPAPVYGAVPQPKQETKTSAETTNEEETETMKTKTTPTAEAAAPGSAGAPTGESVPETTAETTTTETAEADANTAGAVVPPAVMQFPTSADPIQDLLTELNGIQDSANEVLNRLRGLRQKARNVERHYRGKAKEIEAKSQIIAKFQKAVSL